MRSKSIIRSVYGIILSLIAILCLSPNSLYAAPKTPVQVVEIFIEGYGTAKMDQAADVTTAEFRDNKPKSVWVQETWEALNELKYRHKDSSVIDTKVGDEKAIVVVDAKITTVAADARQNEVYILVQQQDRWLIDELIVSDEKIQVDLDDYAL